MLINEVVKDVDVEDQNVIRRGATVELVNINVTLTQRLKLTREETGQGKMFRALAVMRVGTVEKPTLVGCPRQT